MNEHQNTPSFSIEDKLENDINNEFLLPLEYLKPYLLNISKQIIEDLEFDVIYQPIFKEYRSSIATKWIIKKSYKIYTNYIPFLEDTKEIYRNELMKTLPPCNINMNKIIQYWENWLLDKHFHERLNYIEWECLEKLNRSILFLQCMSLISLISPIVSICFPFLILIIPFIMILCIHSTINFDIYLNYFKNIVKNHSLGKICFADNFNQISWNDISTTITSIIIYIYSIFQNIYFCYKFYTQIQTIVNEYQDLYNYFIYTIERATIFSNIISSLSTYSDFYNHLILKINDCIYFRNQLQYILTHSKKPFPWTNLGNYLKLYYEIHQDNDMKKCISYTIGLHAYIDVFEQLSYLIDKHHLHYAIFLENYQENNDSYINEMSYPPLINESFNNTNSISLNKNMILSGPNASGKTTLLKSVIINLIWSQQFSIGFYKSCKFQPYDIFACYLSIPDTSGRDSLFQAEAKRCKEIIDQHDTYPKKRIFCIFDELYSGTNPTEAIHSCISLIHYLNKFNNEIKFLLSTHFVEVCEYFNDIDTNCIYNAKMNTIIQHPHKNQHKHEHHNEHEHEDEHEHKNEYEDKDEDKQYYIPKLKFTYQLLLGISSIQGAKQILHELNYPLEILTYDLKSLKLKNFNL